MMQNRFATGYSFGRVKVDVEVDTADADRWLREFFAPAVEATAFGRGEVAIRLISSHQECDELDLLAGSAEKSIPCFAFDRQLIVFPGWDDGESTVVADRRNRCFYRIRTESIDIVGRPDEPRSRLGLMRVVRETLTARRLARGRFLDLHAAAFAAGRKAVLIAGPKYSGKTTLLCFALTSRRVRAIANDRVLVSIDSDAADVFGVPTLVSIRPETLQQFPDLDMGDDAFDYLGPSQLATRLGSSSVAAAPLSTVVFPEIDSEVDTWTIDRLSDQDGLARLAMCRYGARRNNADRTIFETLASSVPLPIDRRMPADRLAGRVRFFRCRLGRRAYERNANEWLHALHLDTEDTGVDPESTGARTALGPR